ncbi:MAG: PD40 domain-containing protein [Acidobacteria bacterium]|nr:PD40 domain-containing protein [Acidobacteriota bacterium]
MESEPLRFQFDTIEVQPDALAVLRDGQPVSLEPKALRVLIYLIEHRARAVGKDELIQAVWEGAAVTDNALTRIIAQIRREIGDDARQPRYIQTLPTTGYRFIAEVSSPGGSVAAPVSEPPKTSPRRRPMGRLAVAVAGMALVAVAAWLMVRWRMSLPPAAGASVQVTTSSGLDIGACFSPDGRAFAFTSNRSGAFEIYRSSGDGREAVQLTADGQQNIDPAWSPDGQWIAYHSVAQHGVWVVPATGGAPRRLTSFGSTPAWSPDSRQIAFRSSEPISYAWFDTAGTGPSFIWVVAVDGTQLRQVTFPSNSGGGHGKPAWNPDGRRIAFVATGQDGGIEVLDLESGQRQLVVRVGRDIPLQPGTWLTRLWDPRWGTDGRSLYFSAMSGPGEYAIYYLSALNRRPVLFYSTQTDVPAGISLDPAGKRLLFTRFANVSQLWGVTPPEDPAPVFQESVLRAYLPVFSPDGKWLSFLVETAGRNRDLWIMDTATRRVAPVSLDPGPKEGSAGWNLAGTALLYSYVNGDRNEFRRYDPARNTNQTVASWPVGRFFHPVLTPDEKEILGACSTPFNICLSSLDGASRRQITLERSNASYPVISHDGEWIAYGLHRGDSVQLVVTDRAGRSRQMLTDDNGLHWPYSFSADARRIAYAAYRAGVWNVWWVDRVTGEQRQLTHYTTYGAFVRTPMWRPGTEEIVFEYSQVKGNIYRLDLR